jgi:transcriptional regulator with GAF, ATPase, and Fis domain
MQSQSTLRRHVYIGPFSARTREIGALHERADTEHFHSHEQVPLSHNHEKIVGNSRAITELLAQAEQVADTDSTVLILGETGTGKELLAEAIHELSRRKKREMVTVNCAALPPTLIEAELFGRERGAYTGALNKQVGRFELADGTTLFLDEVGELPHEVQAKLLRVLQQGKFERLGGIRTITVDVRVVAATNSDLVARVKNGEFREDLFYRLNVFPIRVPPLRERPEDIPVLVWTFVQEFSERMGKSIDRIPQRDMSALCQYPWPGNVRELRNVIERAMILTKDKTLQVPIPDCDETTSVADLTLAEMEAGYIRRTMERTGWRVRGRGGAAEILGLKPTTLESRMERLSIRRGSS